MASTVQSGSIFFGRSEGARLGYSASVAGDIDGDGWADLILGAPGAAARDAGGAVVSQMAGEAVVILGGPGGFAPVTRLAVAANGPGVALFEGSQAMGRVGTAVAGGGDIDGDGYDDILIGAPFRDQVAGTDAGAAFVVFGGGEALAGWRAGAPAAGSVSQEMQGGAPRAYAGFSVAMVGDIDGDGRADSAIGMPGASLGARFGAGTIEIRFAGTGDRDLDEDGQGGGRLAIHGGAALDAAGAAISAAGDVNGDGIGDLLIGAPAAAGAAAASGAAYVVFGRAGGWQADLDLGALGPGSGVVLRGAASGDLAGVAVASAGDVNGDGIGDVIVGAPDAVGGRGAAYVVYGHRDGLPAAIDLGALDGAAGFRIEGAMAGEALGTSVAGVGDVNGDGFDDVLIGIPRAAAPGRLSPGAATLVFGSAEGPAGGALPGRPAPGEGYVFRGSGSFDAAGITVAAAGDVNGDGWADFMIGADLANDGSRVDAGAVYLVHGGPGILAALDALDGAIDSVIELARVGSSVTVETVFAPAPQSNLAPPPVTEMDNDPDTAPALRGPYDMIADDSVATLGAGPSVAVKPRAGRDGSAVPDGDAPAAEAAEVQATRAWSGTGADASRPRGGIDRWEPGDDSFDFAAMGDGEAARSAVLHPLAEDWRMSTGSGAGTESHDAGIEPADAIQFPVPDDGANWDGLL